MDHSLRRKRFEKAVECLAREMTEIAQDEHADALLRAQALVLIAKVTSTLDSVIKADVAVRELYDPVQQRKLGGALIKILTEQLKEKGGGREGLKIAKALEEVVHHLPK